MNLLFRALIPILTLSLFVQSGQAQVLKTVNSARKPAPNLKIKSSSVPTFEIHKSTTAIPRLDIGEEPTLEAQVSPVNLPVLPPLKGIQVVRKESPKVIELEKKKNPIAAAPPAKSFANSKTLAQIPEVKALKNISEPVTSEPNLETKEMVVFKSQEYKILEGQIYYEFLQNYEMALAHFSELLSDKDYGFEATYQYSQAAAELGLPTEMRTNLLKVAKSAKTPELQTDATWSLVKNIEKLQVSDVKEIENYVQKYDLDTSKNDAYQFYRAKYFLEQGNLGAVEESLQNIDEKSKYYHESLLIKGLSLYRQGKIDAAADALNVLLTKADRSIPVRTVSAITLARIYFQRGMYKEAFLAYGQVDKSHPLWLQAMVEQAWTQILLKDFEGAAGNMFSLHTDFFKNAYNPESYVVRTVGYLNLCQFGDGMNVLNNLGHRYAPMYGRLAGFQERKKAAKDYYDLVRTWLKNPDLREVEGVPRSFIVELARHPSFVAIQKQINNYEDEITAFNNVTLKLVQREKDLLKKQTEANGELSKIRIKMNEPKADIAALKNQEAFQHKRLNSYKYQAQTVNKARSNIKDVREKSFVRIDKEKADAREQAAVALKGRYGVALASMKNVLDQSEVLQYEIYSGAGEHIRYQASGGEIQKKEGNDAPKPEKDKIMKWNFKGEIWEDEIGHFRSSLKNVCASDDSGK